MNYKHNNSRKTSIFFFKCINAGCSLKANILKTTDSVHCCFSTNVRAS